MQQQWIPWKPKEGSLSSGIELSTMSNVIIRHWILEFATQEFIGDSEKAVSVKGWEWKTEWHKI